ncbi:MULTISPECIES: AAA family ATPase [unclassified Clostridium]|uniref:AAA family ATPase n=1 Tax=unclassified Clostridium TaxID=2614128 RepID=UPI0002981A26|nr:MULTISPECIES: AAA family ATPase [unclassified Clostridium]EKQ56043.1 MAG: Chromatin associated protein KTI12 [Clostridium sp. Maddingley MBC34-26]
MYIILIAGMPASGKTTFAKRLSEELQIPMVSKDEIKEILFDTVGFHSREEKVALGVGSMNIMYLFAESLMRTNKLIILENNFENISKPKLQELINKYHCTPITVLFDGDMKTIYNRFIERDKSPTRHRGHVVNTEYPESINSNSISPQIKFEDFQKTFEERGIRHFNISDDTIKIDTTDFDKVNYGDIINQIKNKIGML